MFLRAPLLVPILLRMNPQGFAPGAEAAPEGRKPPAPEGREDEGFAPSRIPSTWPFAVSLGALFRD